MGVVLRSKILRNGKDGLCQEEGWWEVDTLPLPFPNQLVQVLEANSALLPS